MKKKYFRFISIFLAVAVLIILILNFGVNFWLQQKLPSYIKDNSDYKVNYESLSVDVFSGDILASKISVENKNPGNLNVIGLSGDVDTLSISRLGIYDALINKRINSSNLVMVKPNLIVTLAKPVDDKTGKKRNPVLFKNMKISDGNIAVFRHTKQKFLSVKDLNMNVENLQMTEESVERKLPIVFDKYDIRGKKFYFRPDNVYAITANEITTEAGQMSIKQFAVIPLLSFRSFVKYNPDRRNLFDVKAAEMNFKDIALNDNKVTLSNAHFINPNVKIMSTSAKPAAKKDFGFVINMQDILFKNAKVTVLKPDGTPKMSAASATVNISKFLMNSETAKSSIPFQYADFNMAGQQITFSSGDQNINIGGMNFSPKTADLRHILLKPTSANPHKTVVDMKVPRLQLRINELALVDNKLKLDLQNIYITSAQGKIVTGNSTSKKKANFSGVNFPLKIKKVVLNNSNIIYDKGSQPIALNNLNAQIDNIEMNESTVKNAIPFKTLNYAMTTRNLNYRTKYYNLSAGLVKLNKNMLQISNAAVKPVVSRAQFIRMIPAEKDLYDAKVSQITANGSWDFLSEKQYLNASQVTLNNLSANIFRSKLPKDDLTEKPLYSKLLRSIKFPMYIQNLDVKNSMVEYEEDTKKSDGPGKLTFNSFNLNAKNLNSGKMSGKPTQVPININCRFMNASPMNVKWNIDTASMSDAFTIAGNISDLPASRVNPFIEPYLKIRATGLISDLIFNFRGNNAGLNGILNMKHQDLKVSVLKEDGEKNQILSAVANIFVRTNSAKYPASVPVDNIKRERTKSFFNLFWKGIEEGLKKTLIGKNVENTEKTVKKTVENTKEAIDKNKEKVQQRKDEKSGKAEPSEKKGFLKGLFKKKSE